MSQPRFSVVVPTRGRPATLPFTLETCLQQTYPNYEVVVSDNDTSSSTRKIFEQLTCSKLRYVRAPESLAMSDNWNLALAQTTGEYIIYLGDDDGLMPNALNHLAALLTRTPTQALTWRPISYSWPSFVIPGEANFLSLPLAREVITVDSHTRLKDILAGRGNFAALPNIYHGLVHRDIIERSRLPDGRVFTGTFPDTVTSISFAYLAGQLSGSDGAIQHCRVFCGEQPHGLATPPQQSPLVHRI